ncbi:disease resistance RPP13-like protein 4 [Durio zibethinus]|uniref:Disease resistance RPP13-like protein 4 n=1 Tax=Durio zibethinus TaxID=66656 RepID=A0A6P5YMB6_DURZI|nr:disease resistance RPP13-like protein 4 [Durio zibethinus]
MTDAIVNMFLEKLLNTLAEEGRYVTEFRDQFEKLQTDLQLMQCFLKDADRLKRKNHTIRNILADLRELIYEAEDILADCQLQSREDNLFSQGLLTCISPPKLHFKYQSGKRLKEIIEKITHIKQNISSLLGGPLLFQPEVINGGDQMPRWSSHVYDHTQVVGLEADTQKIKDWIFEAAREGRHEILAIGVVGMGGLGKTTIAQKVFNEREIEHQFDRRMWVSVSQTFTEEQIMRSMLRNLGDASVGDDANELLKKINQYLLGKRYLIVMDDVWREDVAWWQRICVGLPKGNGSCIIITTRIEKVSRQMGVKEIRIHRPKFLNKDYSWLLFRKIAFAASEGKCIYPDLEDVGKEIVDKCKGLPLAIKAVGGMMLCKAPYYREWRRIANHFRDELAENDNSVMASLQLSYDELPSYLKSCFLSFSVYPEDCVISKEQVVHWWIGEGFVPLRSGRSSTDAGEDCFSGLTNRCLIEAVDKTYNGTIITCKMHDMVRDVVLKIAEDDAFYRTNGINCRHWGISNNMDRKQLNANQKLRGLLSTTKSGEVNKIESSIAKKFSECRYLRVLDVSKSIFELSLGRLLFHIGSLQHLTYLSLSNTHPLIELPASLEKAYNLQILDVSYCQNLKILPPYLITLKKLKVLDVSHCGSLECLPKGLGRLSNLEVLLGFRPARSGHGCRIGELRNLTRLRILGLHLTHGDEVGDSEVNAMVNLQDLENLSISCFGSHGSDLTSKLDKLYPPQQLHELSLKFYPGKISPIWLNPIALPLLKYLSISSGNLASMHQSFWGADNNFAWKIQALMLESLSDLEVQWPMLQQAMQTLRIVNVSWCPELVSFPIDDVGFRGGVWFKEEHKS